MGECRARQYLRRLCARSIAETATFRPQVSSVAANHRAVRRSRSSREFIAKLQIVNEEADECVLWLELLDDVGVIQADEIKRLLVEARELRAIFARSKATMVDRLRNR